jgi:hypothetical protein
MPESDKYLPFQRLVADRPEVDRKIAGTREHIYFWQQETSFFLKLEGRS